MYKDKIIFSFLKKKFLFLKTNILLALPAAALQCWENFRFDAIVTPIFETLYAFKFHSINLVFIF